MERRRTSPQVAAVHFERTWNPVYWVVALIIGLILGLGFGFRDQIFSRGVPRDETYLVLASTAYAQEPTTASAAALRQRLIGLGFANPSAMAVKLSDTYSLSRDTTRLAEAQGLRIFGEALNGVADAPANVRVQTTTSQPTAQAVPSPTGGTGLAAAGPTATVPQTTPTSTAAAGMVGVSPAGNSISPDTGQLAPTAPADRTALATAEPTAVAPAPTTAALAAAPTGPTGTTKSDDKKPVVLRKDSSTLSAKIASLPVGTKVQVLKTVNGKADDPGIDPKETRWYQVKYNNFTGYIYYKLLSVGG